MAPSDAGTATAGSGRSGLARWLPIMSWLREYDRGWLLPDGIAGVTVWVLMVPEATAYAGIAGVPVQYRAVRHPAGSARLCYAISGSSRELAVGPSASVVALSASAVGAVAVAKARRRPGGPGSIIAIPHPRRSRSSQPRTWCTIRLLTKRRCMAFLSCQLEAVRQPRREHHHAHRADAQPDTDRRHRLPRGTTRPRGPPLQVRAASVRDGPRAGRAYGSCRVRLPR
jgi:hypothetical protein